MYCQYRPDWKFAPDQSDEIWFAEENVIIGGTNQLTMAYTIGLTFSCDVDSQNRFCPNIILLDQSVIWSVNPGINISNWWFILVGSSLFVPNPSFLLVEFRTITGHIWDMLTIWISSMDHSPHGDKLTTPSISQSNFFFLGSLEKDLVNNYSVSMRFLWHRVHIIRFVFQKCLVSHKPRISSEIVGKTNVVRNINNRD
jgi:hypothetical protein